MSQPIEPDKTIVQISQIVSAFDAKRKRSLMPTLAALVTILVAGIAASIMLGVIHFAAFGAMIAFILFIFMEPRIKQSLSRDMMPILVKMAGDFQYDQQGLFTDFLIGNGSLPSGSLAKAEDRISGKIGGVDFDSWEAKITRKSGKRTRTVFDGLIVSMPVDESRWLLVRPAVDPVSEFFRNMFRPVSNQEAEMHEIRIERDGYELWTEKGDWDTSALVEVLISIRNSLPLYARFRGVFQDDGRAYLLLDVARNLYDLGGLFSSKKAVMAHVDKALNEIAVAPSCVAIWATAKDVPRENL